MKKKDDKQIKTINTKKATNILMIVATVLLLGVVGVVIYNASLIRDRDELTKELENTFQADFYELVQGVSDVEGKLAKLAVSSGQSLNVTILNDINHQAQILVLRISHLTPRGGGENSILTFFNQLANFTEYLSGKILFGHHITTQELNKLQLSRGILNRLGEELVSIQDALDSGHSFVMGISGRDRFLADIFDGINSPTTGYPSMFYDGPFVDGREPRVPKGLTGQVVTESQARQIIRNIYGGRDLEIEFLGKSSGKIEAYQFKVQVYEDLQVFISITSIGGRVINLSANRVSEKANLSASHCKNIALGFLEILGFSNMRHVWTSHYRGIYYFNFVYYNGIYFYPDSIRVKVAATDGAVLGIDAHRFFLNHSQRELKTPQISMNEAARRLNSSLIIERASLVVATIRNKEILSFEFKVSNNNQYYFIYIDAKTGEQINILRVIDGKRGMLIQ